MKGANPDVWIATMITPRPAMHVLLSIPATTLLQCSVIATLTIHGHFKNINDRIIPLT